MGFTKISKALILPTRNQMSIHSDNWVLALSTELWCSTPTHRCTEKPYSFIYTCTHMHQHLNVQGYVWALVSTTSPCPSLPLCLGAGAIRCTGWAFRFPLNPSQINGHNTLAGKLQDKEKITGKKKWNQAPSPKAFIEKTSDLSLHLNIRNPK